MKKFIVFALLLIFGLSISATMSASDDNSGVDIPYDTILLHPSRPSGRPNAPSRVYIECTYGIGFINFSFPENIQEVSVEIYNEEESVAGHVTNSFPRLDLPELTGSFTIICMTEDNRVFQGTLIF